jgi:hypothetical protein
MQVPTTDAAGEVTLMDWIKSRRETRRIAAAATYIQWAACVKVLDAMGATNDSMADTDLGRSILFEYARYVTECWQALIFNRIPGEPNLDFQSTGEDYYYYYPREFPANGIYAWIDRNGIDRSEVTGIVASFYRLRRELKKSEQTGESESYLQQLATYAGWAHLTLKRVLPV